MLGRVWSVCVIAAVACGPLEAPESALNCTECVPICAADVDPDDLEGSARRLGCDPDLVRRISPFAGEMVADREHAVEVELARAPLWDAEPSGHGCDGPIRLERVGRVGEVPGAVAADIVTRASITTLPVWPVSRECVPGRWSVSGSSLRFVADQPFDELTWYQVEVVSTLRFEGPGLCSLLDWRFATDGCGNGVVEQAASFIDWVCLGHVEATVGHFQPYLEECDDGNLEFGDACTSYCARLPGWTCDGNDCHTRCGDGIRAGDEACDDANTRDGDGCSADCSSITEPIGGPDLPSP